MLLEHSVWIVVDSSTLKDAEKAMYVCVCSPKMGFGFKTCNKGLGNCWYSPCVVYLRPMVSVFFSDTALQSCLHVFYHFYLPGCIIISFYPEKIFPLPRRVWSKNLDYHLPFGGHPWCNRLFSCFRWNKSLDEKNTAKLDGIFTTST